MTSRRVVCSSRWCFRQNLCSFLLHPPIDRAHRPAPLFHPRHPRLSLLHHRKSLRVTACGQRRPQPSLGHPALLPTQPPNPLCPHPILGLLATAASLHLLMPSPHRHELALHHRHPNPLLIVLFVRLSLPPPQHLCAPLVVPRHHLLSLLLIVLRWVLVLLSLPPPQHLYALLVVLHHHQNYQQQTERRRGRPHPLCPLKHRQACPRHLL